MYGAHDAFVDGHSVVSMGFFADIIDARFVKRDDSDVGMQGRTMHVIM